MEPGDLVVFVAIERVLAGRPARYLLSGWATVGRSVSHTDIWNEDSLAMYRQYLNPLLRPAPGTEDFEYHEMISNDHADWLARIGDAPAQLLKRADAVEAGKSGLLKRGMIEVNGSRLRPAKIFQPQGVSTRFLADSPLLARASRNGKGEAWMQSQLAVDVRKVLLDGKDRKSLRTTNVQTPHPRVKLQAEPPTVKRRSKPLPLSTAWPTGEQEAVRDHYGLAYQSPGSDRFQSWCPYDGPLPCAR